MILLRLLTVLMATSLLSGCYLWGDYNSLKSDIRQLKFYLKSVPVPNECKAPGTPQRRVCYYPLTIKPFDPAKGLYVGRYQGGVLTDARRHCEETKEAIKTGNGGRDQKYDLDDDYRCVDPNNYKYGVYGFKLDGPQLPAGDYGLVNLPGTELLREGTAAEAQWQ